MSLRLGQSPHKGQVREGGHGRQGAHVAEMQRHRLLLAINEVVAERGLEEASVGRICKRAGVSRRTFYDLFEDREACLLAAFDRAIASIADVVIPAYADESRWSTRIRASLSALLELFDSSPAMARLCVIETPRVAGDVSECRKQVIDAAIAAIDEGDSESRQRVALSPVVAQGIVGGCLSVVHARLLETDPEPLIGLVNPLMGMIVQPYLGAAAAKREFERPTPTPLGIAAGGAKDPFSGLSIRFTYRTARVLATIAVHPGASNRLIGDASGVADEGQMSRLLTRLQRSDLIENRGYGQPKGEPNAWMLTERGEAVHAALGMKT